MHDDGDGWDCRDGDSDRADDDDSTDMDDSRAAPATEPAICEDEEQVSYPSTLQEAYLPHSRFRAHSHQGVNMYLRHVRHRGHTERVFRGGPTDRAPQQGHTRMADGRTAVDRAATGVDAQAHRWALLFFRPFLIRKIRMDIVDNKCSWCTNVELAVATHEQRAVLDAN